MKKVKIISTLRSRGEKHLSPETEERKTFLKIKEMECPCCGDKMKLEADVWRCQKCSYCIEQKSILEGAIFWFCDNCGKFMNVQPDFTAADGKWKCVSCGFVNDVSENNILDDDANKVPPVKDFIGQRVGVLYSEAKKLNDTIAPQIVQGIGDTAQKTGAALAVGKTAVLGAGENAKEAIVEQLDINHDGKVDIEDIIILGLKTPGVKIDRAEFLANEFRIHYDAETVDKAIETTPLRAGIPLDDINKMAEAVIQHERYFVSGISAALGAPGGVAMVATIPTDIIQYYGYTLRAAQELMYLYGFPEIVSEDNNAQIDTPTMNTLIVAMGVMFGVAGANNAIKAMAKALGVGVERQLMKKALTKGAIYHIVKSVAKWFGVKMTKEVFSGFFKNAIPVAGGIIGGGITYLSFKPCCERLKASLMDTKLSNPEHQESKEEVEIFEAIVTDANDLS